MEQLITEQLKYLVLAKHYFLHQIRSLPQNSKIQVISNNCYTIKFSQLNRMNLSPHHYDYTWCYNALADILHSKPTEDIIDYLKEVIKNRLFIKDKVRYYITDEVAYNLYQITCTQ